MGAPEGSSHSVTAPFPPPLKTALLEGDWSSRLFSQMRVTHRCRGVNFKAVSREFKIRLVMKPCNPCTPLFTMRLWASVCIIVNEENNWTVMLNHCHVHLFSAP